jgi:hypothetical protein
MSNPLDNALASLAQSRLLYHSGLVQQQKQPPIYTYLGESQGHSILQTAGGVVEVGQPITNGSIVKGSIVPVHVAGSLVRVDGMPRYIADEQPVVEAAKGSIQILYSTIEDGKTLFWLGGHQAEQVRVATVPTTNFLNAYVSNLGKANYIAHIYYSIEAGLTQNIVQRGAEVIDKISYSNPYGHGFWSGGRSQTTSDTVFLSSAILYSNAFYKDQEADFVGAFSSVFIFRPNSQLSTRETSYSIEQMILPGVTRTSRGYDFNIGGGTSFEVVDRDIYSLAVVGKDRNTAIYRFNRERKIGINGRFDSSSGVALTDLSGGETVLGGQLPPFSNSYLDFSPAHNLIGRRYYIVQSPDLNLNSLLSLQGKETDVDIYALGPNGTKKSKKVKIYKGIPSSGTRIWNASYHP